MKSCFYKATKFYWNKLINMFGLVFASASLSVVSVNTQLFQSSASHALDNAVNNSGVVEFKAVEIKNGEIILSAKPDDKSTLSNTKNGTSKKNSKK